VVTRVKNLVIKCFDNKLNQLVLKGKVVSNSPRIWRWLGRIMKSVPMKQDSTL